MSDPGDKIGLQKATRAWAELAGALACEGRYPAAAQAEARRAVQIAAFLCMAGSRDITGFETPLQQVCRFGEEPLDDSALWSELRDPLRAKLVGAIEPLFPSRPGETPPVEILGRIHERLLGRRLQRDGPGRWKTTAAEAAKRSAGVFYTPPQVADYIARQAIARPAQRISVLDPACGCGVFLLAAYRQAGDRAALHGVDLDPEAILIARRSLWLAVAAGGRRHADDRWLKQIRAADAIADPELDAARGRFDVVIGNPPYRRELGAADVLGRLAHTELGRRWRMPRMDLWYYFLHRGLELLRPGGRLGYIVGSYWTAASSAAKLIAEIRDSAHIEEIVCLPPSAVFPRVAGRQLIVAIVKEVARRPTIIRRPTRDSNSWEELLEGRGDSFQKSPGQLFRSGQIDLEPACDALLAALDRWPPLGQLGVVRQGIAENPACVPARAAAQQGPWQPGEGVFVLRPEESARLSLSDAERDLLRPYHVLADLGRYWIADATSRRLIYSTPRTWADEGQFPLLRAHLARFRSLMEARRETRLGRRAWWHLHWPRDESLWQSSKLIAVQMGPRPAFAPAVGPAYVPFSVNVFVPDGRTGEHLYYLAGLLNSRLLWKWFQHHAKRRGVGLEINGHVLAAAPLRRIDMTAPADRAAHDTVVHLVSRRLELEQRQRATGAPCPEAEPLETEIDRLVCELYGVGPALTTDR